MRRIFRVGAIVALLGAASFGVVACGGDDDGGGGGDELTLEEYFTKLEAASDSFTEEGDAAAEDLGDTEDVDAIKDSFAKLPGIVEDFMDEVDELNPPEEAQEAHDEAVEAGRAFADEVNTVLDDLDGVDSIEELTEFEFGDGFDEADERFSAACRDLQTLADDNSIDIDLQCDDDA